MSRRSTKGIVPIGFLLLIAGLIMTIIGGVYAKKPDNDPKRKTATYLLAIGVPMLIIGFLMFFS